MLPRKAFREAHREERRAYGKAYREAHREKMRAYSRTHYRENREECLAKFKAYYEGNREERLARSKVNHAARCAAWAAWLQSKGFDSCAACGYSEDYRNLHFHHVDPKSKEYDIARFTSAAPCTPERQAELQPELDKCVILCVRCHTGAKGCIHSKNPSERVLAAVYGRQSKAA